MAPRISATWGGAGHHPGRLAPMGLLPSPYRTPLLQGLWRDAGVDRPPAPLLQTCWSFPNLIRFLVWEAVRADRESHGP